MENGLEEPRMVLGITADRLLKEIQTRNLNWGGSSRKRTDNFKAYLGDQTGITR